MAAESRPPRYVARRQRGVLRAGVPAPRDVPRASVRAFLARSRACLARPRASLARSRRSCASRRRSRCSSRCACVLGVRRGRELDRRARAALALLLAARLCRAARRVWRRRRWDSSVAFLASRARCRRALRCALSAERLASSFRSSASGRRAAAVDGGVAWATARWRPLPECDCRAKNSAAATAAASIRPTPSTARLLMCVPPDDRSRPQDVQRTAGLYTA